MQRLLLDKRKIQRQEEKEREEEEMLRADSLDETRQQLEMEKMVGWNMPIYVVFTYEFIWSRFVLSGS